MNRFARETDCPICRRRVQTQNAGDLAFVECPQCGTFKLSPADAAAISGWWEDAQRSALSCATRQAAEAGAPYSIASEDEAKQLAERHRHTRVADNQMRLLREIAKRVKRPDGKAILDSGRDFTLIDCFNSAEFNWYLNSLEEKGLLRCQLPGPMHDGSHSLSPEGWNQVQPLPRPGGIPGRCFVAMSFAAEMNDAFETGIAPAVARAGFEAIRIDRKEHNEEITDQIVAEIRDAQFVVADFTGQRAGSLL